MIREFTEADWMGLAGAERWNDGKAPLLADPSKATDYFLTADSNGIFVYYSPEEGEEVSYVLRLEMPTQQVGRLFLDGFVKELDRICLVLPEAIPDFLLGYGFGEC